MGRASRDLGVRGEELAARHLEARGYTILARNVRHGHREVDLIARRDGALAFVEVKSRAGTGFGHPLAAITPLKRREVERVARWWLRSHGRSGLQPRFDAVSVVFRREGDPIIEHIPNAWRLGE